MKHAFEHRPRPPGVYPLVFFICTRCGLESWSDRTEYGHQKVCDRCQRLGPPPRLTSYGVHRPPPDAYEGHEVMLAYGELDEPPQPSWTSDDRPRVFDLWRGMNARSFARELERRR